ncbi:hypothetical protein J6590_019619 [Homalodisca vitripennis]|nr:hypothetical protein J6590_019619 [Homalodisca vitripennis]
MEENAHDTSACPTLATARSRLSEHCRCDGHGQQAELVGLAAQERRRCCFRPRRDRGETMN